MAIKVGNDIGHGQNTFPPSKGIYKGGKGYAEHTFNAKVGIEIREHLQRHGVHSMEAQAPNKSDVRLRTRTDYYNAHRVNLVWSSHANYNSKKAVKGMGIFYWKGTQKGKEIAEYYIKLCREAGLPIWGSGVFTSTDVPVDHWTNFAITRDTNAVALLAENGFFSNDEDFERIFNTPSYIKLVGEISAKSILYGVGVTWKPLKTAVKAESKPVVVTKPKPKPIVTPISKPIEEENKMIDVAIVVNGFDDIPSVEKLTIRLGCPLYFRNAVKSKQAKHLIIAGGGVQNLAKFTDKVTDLSGKNRETTAINVTKYMNK